MNLFKTPQWEDAGDQSGTVGAETVQSSGEKVNRKRKRRKSKQDNSPSPTKNITSLNGNNDSTVKQPNPLQTVLQKVKEKVFSISLNMPVKKIGEALSPEEKKKLQSKRKKLKRKLMKKQISKLTEETPGTSKEFPSPLKSSDISKLSLESGNREALNKAQKKKLRRKLKRQQKSAANEGAPVNFEKSASTPKEETPSASKKINKRRRRKVRIEVQQGLNMSPGKIDKISEKHEELQSSVKAGNGNSVDDSTKKTHHLALTPINNTPLEQMKLKKKLKRLLRRKKQKESTLKKLDVAQKVLSSNEIVLTKSQKKKMRRIAKKQSDKESSMDVGEISVQGTVNSTYDTSVTEMTSNPTENENKGVKTKKKARRQRRKKIADTVDGNSLSSSGQITISQKGGSKTETKRADIPDVLETGSQPGKGKKKVIIAQLLQQSNIMENTTLHGLKKRRLEEAESSQSSGSAKKLKQVPSTLIEKCAEQAKSARFRYLNEQLYSSTSWEAMKYFKEDSAAFDAYHSGYRNQVALWPLNPLDVIIKSLSSFPADTVVADFGCGEARLAESLPQLKVHSLDLVAIKPGVVACDMAHTPLLMESVDVAVFCLSLMGTNLNDFLLEANRVLKNGGLLKVAEVESRFEDVDNFTSSLVHFGFHLKKKDLNNKMFIFMDFKKNHKVSKTGKLPTIKLDPCVYKKR